MLSPPTISVDVVPALRLHERLGLVEPYVQPNAPMLHKRLVDWKMEDDDSPIFRYLYRQLKPARHLEFGTWKGTGTVSCLEECDATVFTINLLDGELLADGRWAYGDRLRDEESTQGLITRKGQGGSTIVQSDARGSIGREYLERGYGSRVCQMYCDSRKWDDANFPDGFFDSVLIDGGHDCEVVMSDTQRALRLVRPGGVVMWHDYCPDQEVLAACSSTVGVHEAIKQTRGALDELLSDLFWIDPSWILVGVRELKVFDCPIG